MCANIAENKGGKHGLIRSFTGDLQRFLELAKNGNLYEYIRDNLEHCYIQKNGAAPLFCGASPKDSRLYMGIFLYLETTRKQCAQDLRIPLKLESTDILSRDKFLKLQRLQSLSQWSVHCPHRQGKSFFLAYPNTGQTMIALC